MLPIDFYVAPQDHPHIDLLLGRQWIARHNLQLDWLARTFSMKVADSVISGKSAELECCLPIETKCVEDASSTWIVNDYNPTHGWLVKNSHLEKQAYGRGEQAIHDMWLPEKSYALLPPPQPTPPCPPRTKYVWVPKVRKQTETKPKESAKTHYSSVETTVDISSSAYDSPG